MAQSGWRLPDDLLKRVRVRAAEDGVRQNAWVVRALESALSEAEGSFGRKQSAPDPVGSSEPARAAASTRAPVVGVSSSARADSDQRKAALARQARLNREKGL